MRLIDANELMRKVSSSPLIDFTDDDIFELINDLPAIKITVDISEEQAIDKLRETGWLFEHDREMTRRPTGKWIDESKDSLKCTACGKRVYKPFIGGFPTERTSHYYPNYCAFCGAKMKGGETVAENDMHNPGP